MWDDQEGALPDGTAEWVDEQLPELDVGDLEPGDLYPGMYAGVEFHVDALRRPFRNTRRGRQFMTNAEARSATELVFRLKRGGKFVVSSDNYMVTRVNGDLVFLGVLDGKPEFETRSTSQFGLLDGAPPTFDAGPVNPSCLFALERFDPEYRERARHPSQCHSGTCDRHHHPHRQL